MLSNFKLLKLFTLISLILCCHTVFSNSDSKLSIKSNNNLGNEDAKYTLVEYASMSCIHCANFHNNEFPKIKRAFIDTGKLKFIYKDFPLDKPAMFASMVTNCFKGEQYYEVLSSLYRNQKSWVSVSNNSGKFYSAIHDSLKIHGIKLQKVLECVDDENDTNKATWNNIIKTRLEGQSNGVSSTPSFFLNGKKIEEPLNYELLEKLIK